MFGLFLLFFVGQSIAGWGVTNEQREQYGQSPIQWSTYLKSGDFWEASGENWESEFLQWRSAESEKPTDEAVKENEENPKERPKGLRGSNQHERPSESEQVPWPVRKGGLILAIYSHSH